MAVMLETSVGELVIDLYTNEAPLASLNFLKLCKAKHYNNCPFYGLDKDFVVRVGGETLCRTGTASDLEVVGNGTSIHGLISRKLRKHGTATTTAAGRWRVVPVEASDKLRHNKLGIVGMTCKRAEDGIASELYITLRDKIPYFDKKHTIMGEVAEGLDSVLLAQINSAVTDDEQRLIRPIRIYHTEILDDPFDDPPELHRIIPEQSPERLLDCDANPDDAVLGAEDEVALLDNIAKKEAKSRAVTLEILGDLQDAEMKPPENVLFVCKLNPITEDKDLEIIFARFGKIVSCNIIRDWKTDDSLQYAFVEFEAVKSCEDAYFKMNNVVIDDRRIHVNFCQSVAKQWKDFVHDRNRRKAIKRHTNNVTHQQLKAHSSSPTTTTTADNNNHSTQRGLQYRHPRQEQRHHPSRAGSDADHRQSSNSTDAQPSFEQVHSRAPRRQRSRSPHSRPTGQRRRRHSSSSSSSGDQHHQRRGGQQRREYYK